ncbi:hypothetical protein GGE65_008106 [Skermanella aerolata]|uniref:hypothetical protein n=1 Tax=Skermanella aerolata TaxID=393310 RepID=UPI003D1B88C4
MVLQTRTLDATLHDLFTSWYLAVPANDVQPTPLCRNLNCPTVSVALVRLRGHQPTIDYVRRRTAEGKTKAEIIRCLKRFVVREIFGHLCRPPKPAPSDQDAA